eukprot:183828-Pleurochrysis_carterae.AAC.1
MVGVALVLGSTAVYALEPIPVHASHCDGSHCDAAQGGLLFLRRCLCGLCGFCAAANVTEVLPLGDVEELRRFSEHSVQDDAFSTKSKSYESSLNFGGIEERSDHGSTPPPS